MPTGFVLAQFEDGVHVGYWNEDETDFFESELECTWFTSRDAAAEALGEIARKHDVRIYCLMPSPDPVARLDEPISARLPEFLKQ